MKSGVLGFRRIQFAIYSSIMIDNSVITGLQLLNEGCSSYGNSVVMYSRILQAAQVQFRPKFKQMTSIHVYVRFKPSLFLAVNVM